MVQNLLKLIKQKWAYLWSSEIALNTKCYMTIEGVVLKVLLILKAFPNHITSSLSISIRKQKKKNNEMMDERWKTGLKYTLKTQ